MGKADTKNTISTGNCTGGQIQEALDFLIYKGIEPIIKYSNVFDVQLAYILGNSCTNKKRKLSALPREDFHNRLCSILVSSDNNVKYNLLTQAKIERSFVYGFLVNFLKETDGYCDIYTNYLTCKNCQTRKELEQRLNVIEKTVGFSRDHLFHTIQICSCYLELAYKFRNQIVEHYLKHGYKQAHAFFKTKGLNYSFSDLYQSIMTAVTKAIDKYDSSMGALTSYINFWVLNAQTYPGSNYGHEYGIAYTLPQGQKRKIQGKATDQVNFSVSLDSVLDDSEDSESGLVDFLVGSSGVDKQFEEQDELNTLLFLIKSADSKGLARLYLDIDEYISFKEKVRMAKTMQEQLGYLPKNLDSKIVKNCK